MQEPLAKAAIIVRTRELRLAERLSSTFESAEDSERGRLLARTLLVGMLLVLFATTPAAAQTNPVCTDSSGTLQDMIEGFVQITTTLGIIGLLVVWQADSLMEMFTLSREQKMSIKEHKRGAMKSAGTLVVLGPLFTVAGSSMGLPIAECVDLVPF